MGIFDIIEMKQHVNSIGEYVFYLDAHRDEFELCSSLIREHLKKMITILDKMEK